MPQASIGVSLEKSGPGNKIRSPTWYRIPGGETARKEDILHHSGVNILQPLPLSAIKFGFDLFLGVFAFFSPGPAYRESTLAHLAVSVSMLLAYSASFAVIPVAGMSSVRAEFDMTVMTLDSDLSRQFHLQTAWRGYN